MIFNIFLSFAAVALVGFLFGIILCEIIDGVEITEEEKRTKAEEKEE